MSKIKQILTSWKVVILILIVIGAVLAINPKMESPGVRITSVETNSSADINGVQASGIIISLNGEQILTEEDFARVSSEIAPGTIAKLSTDQETYSFLAEENIGIEVEQMPKSNIRKGLDLVGGIRVLLEPEEKLTPLQIQDIVDITERRLNVYGLSDIQVRQVSDFDKNSFIQVEMAGATQSEVTKLITQQGKFAAKIGDETVFVGGIDVKQVGRSVQEGAGIERCGQAEQEVWACSFQFPVTVSTDSAKKHAEITSKLNVTSNTTGESYLSEKLDLYVDDGLVDSLLISSSLKGIETPTFTIQGSGFGKTEAEASQNTLENMKSLQTILITGSLPVKLNIAKIDVVSPTLGEGFFQTAVYAILAAIAAVAIVLYIRYRSLKLTALMVINDIFELVIIFGIAAMIKWNIDLAAIAGIIAAIGTGVDDQIVIADEVLGKKEGTGGWKERLKRAFFVIFGAYGTVVVAMIPLWAIGAGLLRGFAIITIIGVSVGVFITRPAFAKMAEILLK